MFWSMMKQLAKKIPLKRRVRMAASLVPSRYWFQVVILMSRWHAHVSAALGRRRRGLAEAYLRENWLIELTRLGSFPVPIQVSGAELLQPAESERAGVVLCATHVPWIAVVVRAAILSGHEPKLIIIDPGSILLNNHEFQPTGLDHRIPAIAPGPGGLLKIRTILRQKGLVACTLDKRAGGPSYPDLLVLAGRVGARVVTFQAELTREGVVKVAFQNTLHPYCETREAIEENLEAILANERRTLAALDGLVDTDATIVELSESDTLPGPPEKMKDELFAVTPPATTPAPKPLQRLPCNR